MKRFVQRVQTAVFVTNWLAEQTSKQRHEADMKLSSSSAATSSSTSKEIPLILENPKFHYPFHKSPPPVPILSRINPVCALPYPSFNIQFDNTLKSTAKSSKWFFPSDFRTQTLYVFIFSLFMPHDLPISLFLTLSPQQVYTYCATVCSLLLHPL